MSKVLIVGSGAFGTAIANILMNNKHHVNIYGVDKNQIIDLQKGYNHKFFNDIKLDSIPNLATNVFDQAIIDVEYLIIAIPSKSIRTFLEQYHHKINKNIIIINASKGIDNTNNKNYFEVIKEFLPENQIAAIAGPTFAIDLIKKQYSVSNIVSKNNDVCNKVINLLQTDFFKLQASNDEIGISIYSALKNVIAIGSGFLFGMNYSINTIAAFVNLGLQEINRYVLLKHGKLNTILDFAAIGDTFLTCFSNQSRNYNFGYELAQNDVKNILNKNITVEGFSTINNIYNEIKDDDNFAILNLIYKLTNQQINKDEFIRLIWSYIR